MILTVAIDENLTCVQLDIFDGDTGAVIGGVFNLLEREGPSNAQAPGKRLLLHIAAGPLADDRPATDTSRAQRDARPLADECLGREDIDTVIGHWYAFSDYAVIGGRLNEDSNTRSDWP